MSGGPNPFPVDMADAWRGVERLLAVRLDNLGDVVMTTPALAAIRESLPGVHLTLLASPSGAMAVPHLEGIDEVWTCAPPWMPARAGLPPEDGAAWVRRLAEGGFDAAVIFTVCTQSALPAALWCQMAGIPLRLAFSRENPYGLLTDWVPETDVIADGMRHEVRRHLDLVASVGLRVTDERLRFEVREPDRQGLRARLDEALSQAGLARGTPYALLHPGATAASRRWPAAAFGQAGRMIAEGSGCAVVFSGDASDLEWIAEARAAMGAMGASSISLGGALSLGELAALIEGAAVLVANNSAPAHLAAALGTPVVDLYALTNPQHTPWQARARVLNHPVPCRWCLKSTCPQGHHDCLRLVAPEQVAQAAFELLRPVPPTAPPTAPDGPDTLNTSNIPHTDSMKETLA